MILKAIIRILVIFALVVGIAAGLMYIGMPVNEVSAQDNTDTITVEVEYEDGTPVERGELRGLDVAGNIMSEVQISDGTATLPDENYNQYEVFTWDSINSNSQYVGSYTAKTSEIDVNPSEVTAVVIPYSEAVYTYDSVSDYEAGEWSANVYVQDTYTLGSYTYTGSFVYLTSDGNPDSYERDVWYNTPTFSLSADTEYTIAGVPSGYTELYRADGTEVGDITGSRDTGEFGAGEYYLRVSTTGNDGGVNTEIGVIQILNEESATVRAESETVTESEPDIVYSGSTGTGDESGGSFLSQFSVDSPYSFSFLRPLQSTSK